LSLLYFFRDQTPEYFYSLEIFTKERIILEQCSGTKLSLTVPALNLAVFWEPLYENIAQSAGNLLSFNFLESLRGYTPKYFGCSLEIFTFPLCKTLRYIHTDNNSKNLDKSLFSYYLTGVIEGDGTIITPKTLRSPKGKLNYPAWRSRKSLFVWEKLSNSRDALKLMVPNNS
jgi:hypothetical protein